jgi:type 1 glutamine amidotransferase
MKLRRQLFISLLGLCAVLSMMAQASHADEKHAKIKVLIVDGFSNHDWQQTTLLLRGILEPSGLFDIAVSTAPPTTEASGWDQWRPKFGDYDVVIQTCNDIHGGPSWPEQVQTAFEQFVKNGGGVLVFHSGNNAFPNWPAYNQIIGLGWRNKQQGVALTIDKDEKIITIPVGEGEGTGHLPRGDVLVHRLGNHPIHEGMPKEWMTPGLEVYYYARGPAENVQVLSYGYDPHTKMNWPLEWTVTYGQGRVYTSTFGHVWKGDIQPASMRCAGEQTLILRALQWLAKRPVTVPIPNDFPTATAVSIRPEIVLPK